MLSNTVIQKQSDDLSGMYFENAIDLLVNYAGLTLAFVGPRIVEVNRTPSDNPVVKIVRDVLDLYLQHYNALGSSDSILSVVPVLIAFIKEKLKEKNIILDSSHELHKLLSTICENANVNYECIASNFSKQILDHWFLSYCMEKTVPSLQEITEIITRNIENIKTNFFRSSELTFYILQNKDFLNKYAGITLNLLPRFIIEYGPVSLDEFIACLYMVRLIDAIIKNEDASQLMNHEDVRQAIKNYPLTLIYIFLAENDEHNHAQDCINLLIQAGHLSDKQDISDPDQPLHYLKFFNSLSNEFYFQIMHFLNKRTEFAKVFLPAVITSVEDAYQICLRLSFIYPQISDCIISLFNIDLNKLFYLAADTNNHAVMQHLAKEFPDKIDVIKIDPVTGLTPLHASVKKSYHAKNATILISLNRNCLFARDAENKFPGDYRFVWPVQKEMGWDQISVWLAGRYDEKFKCFNLPEEIFMIVSLFLAEAHCGDESLSALEPKRFLEPEKMEYGYRMSQ